MRARGTRVKDFPRSASRGASRLAPPTLHHGLHLPPRRGDLPVQGPAVAKAGDGVLLSDFLRRNIMLRFQEDAIGIRLRDVIGPDDMMWDNTMWGSDYPHR
jgi:hypothetical protein